MASKKIRVLVVDDSVVMRAIIADTIAAEADMEVAGTAADGERAVEACRRLVPDVVTLDVQMPKMDGLAALEEILAARPVPVLMVSSLTQLGAGTTLDALDRGAIDYVAKPENSAEASAVLGGELIRKIRSVAGADVERILRIRRQRSQQRQQQPQGKASLRMPSQPAPAAAAATKTECCIAVGISTGGPPALAALFEALRPPLPPIVVVQHMPPQFTKSLAWRLNSISQFTIKEAADGDVLRPDQVLIAPGGRHLRLSRTGSIVKAIIRDGPPVSGHKPSVDVMMQSVAQAFPRRCLGVIMTGMGRDGADGCAAIKAAGGYTLGQDEATSDVYGMNKVAHVEGHVDRQFSLEQAAAVVTQQVRRLWG